MKQLPQRNLYKVTVETLMKRCDGDTDDAMKRRATTIAVSITIDRSEAVQVTTMSEDD